MTGQGSRAGLAEGVVTFSMQWMNFVLNRCDRGKGHKPRWAFHGVDFILHSSSPNFTRYLPTDEFNRFKTLVEACYEHIIGEAEESASSDGKNPGSRQGSAGASRTSRTPVSPGRLKF